MGLLFSILFDPRQANHLNLVISSFENSVDLDQLASREAN